MNHIVWFAFILMATHMASGSVIVVDQNHENASDANPGTADAPFRSISAAAKMAKAGDTVIVKSGVYRVFSTHDGIIKSTPSINIPKPGKRQASPYSYYTPSSDELTSSDDLSR